MMLLLLRKAHPATRTMIGGDPTPAQAKSGDYPKLRRQWHGLTIAIEHPEGTVREGVDETGKEWRTVFRYAYGEILGTMGLDGDPVDVFIGSYPDAPEVYIVQQMKRKQWDVADEQKVMIDFASIDEARAAYLSHYDDPRFFGGITAMPVAKFVAKVRATKDKPAMIKALFLKTHVNGYTRSDGTPVAPHEDKRQPQRLADDIAAQEKWLHEQAVSLGYRDIEDLVERDYPAFDRLAAKWREDHPVEVALKSAPARTVLFFKGYVGPYLRGGKIVNVSGYQGRSARAQAAPGQLSLFGSNKPLVPSPYKDKHPVHDTPDMFEEPQHTEPTRELIAEHERLVDVLNSPSHADDKAEAKRQAAELAELKREAAKPDPEAELRAMWTRQGVSKERQDELIAQIAGKAKPGAQVGPFTVPQEAPAKPEDATPDHLLADIPGAKWRRGKGLIAGHYGVEVNGEGVGNFHTKPEDAVAEAKQWLANHAASDKAKAERAEAIGKLRERLMSGVHPSDADLKLLGLREESSGLEWFIPAAAEVFGISSRAVRPYISEMIRIGHTDMGVKKEFVNPKAALLAIAAARSEAEKGRQAAASYNAAATSTKEWPSAEEAANPRRKYYVTIARQGRGVSKLAGPFDTHEEAKAHVDRAREEAYKVDPRSHFDAFGTAGIEADEHKPGVLNERLGIGAKPAPYKPVTDDSHPAPMPRMLMAGLPEDRRDEWKDLHRQQHELHHYELGQVREKMERLRSKKNKAESAMREAEAAVRSLRSSPFRDEPREAEAQKWADKTRAEFDKLSREYEGLVGQHQSLYERVAQLGRAKEKILAGSGDMDRDFASMEKRTAEQQRAHEKDMLQRYRQHYKDLDAERKAAKKAGQPMTKSIVFVRRPAMAS